MGAKRKREKLFLDEIEQTERRRSSRIIALEEKKKEREREKKALALARKNNNSANHVNGNKGKGKATIDAGDHFIDGVNEDEQHGPSKKGRKCKALHQLISSTQPVQEGQHPEYGSTLRTNASSLNGMPEKHVLEFVLDLLQRKDPDELFAEPVNPDVVENYYQIVKQPMDFATMRAKLHEGTYKNFEQFKRDVYLICSNAVNANPANTTYHRVAEAINGHARKVFEGLSADPEHFDLEFSLNKRCPSRKPQGGQPRTSRHAGLPPKPPGRNNGTRTVPEIEKRDMYWPPINKSLLSEFLNASKPNFQLNIDACNYQDSLLRFVEDLGPTAKIVAAKKLEALKSQQLLNGDTPTPSLLENVSGTQITPQPTPQAPTQPDDPNNAHRLSLDLPFSNRPLNIPGAAARENCRNANTIAGVVNIRGGAYKGKKACVYDGWDACAAALLANVFLSPDKGESGSRLMGDSSDARGIMEIWGPSKDKMVSSLGNVSSLLGPVQECANQNPELQWNPSGEIPYSLNKYIGPKDVTERSSRMQTVVWPTRVISGPKPKPLESISGKSLSGLSFFPQRRAEDSTPGINLSTLSPLSQQRPTGSMSGIDTSRVSLLSQPKLAESMPRNTLSGQSVLPSQAAKFSNWNEPGTSLHGLGTPYEPGNFQAILGSTNLKNRPYPAQASHQHVLTQAAPYTTPASYGFSDLQMQLSQLDPVGPFPLREPKFSSAPEMPLGGAMNHFGVGAALGGQPEEAPEMLLGGAMNYHGVDAALGGQPEEAPPQQLLWDDGQQPNLALQL